MTTVQLNHSSNEKPFVIGNGYFQANNQIVMGKFEKHSG